MDINAEPSLNQVLDQHTLEELGVPENSKAYSDIDPVLNMDYSEFKDPDLDFWTTQATNAAANLSTSLGANSVDEMGSRFREAIEDFHSNFSDYSTQNPVFVSEEVLDEVGDQTVGYLKVQGDPRIYPVTVRSFEEFEEGLDDVLIFDKGDLDDSGLQDANSEQSTEEYRRSMKERALKNDFILPTYWNQSGLPRNFNASFVTNGNQLTWDIESDEALQAENMSEYRGDITEIELDEGYAVQIDLSDYRDPELDASIDEGVLVISDRDKEIYRSEYIDGGLSEVTEEEMNELTGSYVVEVI